MRIGYATGYWKQGPPPGALRAIRTAERLGYESVWTAEAYGSDAFTPLAWWGSRTSRIKLGTGIAQLSARTPAATAMAALTLDHLSGGRVTIGAGFGWNTDELADHHVPADRRRTVLREYVEAMRALWTQEEAAYDGEFVSFGPSWAYPKPVQAHVPLLIGAEAGPKTIQWIASHADGWMTTPRSTDIPGRIAALRRAWSEHGREGKPAVHVLIASRPAPEDLAAWADTGVDELIWGVPDADEQAVLASLDRLATKVATLR